MGLFDNPYVEVKKAGKQIGTPEHREVAREVARQSVVLLKNENKLLPLSKEVKRVAIVGPNADNVYNQLGDYTAPQAPGSVITVFEGIRQKLPGAEIRYVKGCRARHVEHVDRGGLRGGKEFRRRGGCFGWFQCTGF